MACNPTVQYDDFNGDGQTTAYTITFEYDNNTDVQVRLGTYPNFTYPTYTTDYSVDAANPSTINFVSAPSGPIRIFRCTPDNVLPATFQAGSSIRSSDLNNNFRQLLFVTQDSSIRTVDTQSVADTAITQSNTAITDSAAAVTTANSADAKATSALAAVNNVTAYTVVTSISQLPASPTNGDRYEVRDSTGAATASISGLPSGVTFGATVVLRLEVVNNGYSFLDYFIPDPDSRYLNSPALTGTPTAPTATQGTDTTQLATTAFVNAAVVSKAPIASPTFTGTVTIPAGASIADIGTTIQAFDADTTKNDVANTFSAAQTFNGGLTVDGSYKQTAEAVAALTIDLSTGNYFTKTITTTSQFVFSNPPASGTVGSFTLELTHTAGAVQWPSSVEFAGGAAPTLSTGKTHLFVFVTDDGGTRYRGAVLADYVN